MTTATTNAPLDIDAVIVENIALLAKCQVFIADRIDRAVAGEVFTLEDLTATVSALAEFNAAFLATRPIVWQLQQPRSVEPSSTPETRKPGAHLRRVT